MSISPKTANSDPDPSMLSPDRIRVHRKTRSRPDVVRNLMSRYDYQLKFVVDSPADLGEVDRCLSQWPGVRDENVWLMPEGVELTTLVEKERWMKPICESRGFRLCSRKHIEWYGNRRGT